MRFEILFQFIVPLTFLAIWALTSILNRDAQPLPPRPGRPGPGGPGGPRPSIGGMGPGQLDLRGGTAADAAMPTPLSPSASPSASGSTARLPSPSPIAGRDRERTTQRGALGVEDAIVFIEGGAGRGGARTGALAGATGSTPSNPSRTARGGAHRRGARGRSGAPARTAPPQSSDLKTQRALSDMVNQSMALRQNRPLELTPLYSPLEALARPLSQVTPASEVTQTRISDARPSVTGADLRAMLASPGKLREIALLGELLQPPLALRRARPLPVPPRVPPPPLPPGSGAADSDAPSHPPGPPQA